MITEQFKSKIAHKTQLETERRQQLLDNGLQDQDIISQQLQDEEATYRMLSETPSATILVTPMEQSHKLAPRIEEAGSSKKHRENLRIRTLKNLAEGRKEVGRLATSQTVPLMQSMKKNVADLQRRRQRETVDIMKLANITIPREIFDVSFTKEHSHFDVKKALIIKSQLGRIAEFKEKNRQEYALLNFDVYSKFEALLDMKEPFETTLKIVLAANGLSETGEKLPEEAIIEAREQYYIVKDSYRETIGEPQEMLAAKRQELIDKRKADLTFGKEVLSSRVQMRNTLMMHWDAMATRDQDWVAIPEGFVRSTFYARVVNRLDAGSEENSYPIMKSAIQAYRLKSQTDMDPVERDKAFETLRKEITPTYNELRKKLPEMVAKIQGATTDELVDMLQEITLLEAPLMHISDIIKGCKDSQGKSIEDTFGMGPTEMEMIRFANNVLSFARKKAVFANAIKAVKAGIPLEYDKLDANLSNALRTVSQTDGNVDPDAALSVLQEQLTRSQAAYVNTITEFTDLHNQQQQEEIDRIQQMKDKSAQIKTERSTHSAKMMRYAHDAFNNNVTRYYDTFMENEVQEKDLTHLYELYKQSGLVYSKSGDKDPEAVAQAGFLRTIRELLAGGGNGNMDFSQERLIGLVGEKEITLDELTDLFEHFDEEHIMNFLKPFWDFDHEAQLAQFDVGTFDNMEELFRKGGETRGFSHKALVMKQWVEVFFLNNSILSEESRKKLRIAAGKFVVSSSATGSITLPTGYSPTEFLEVDVPGFKNVMSSLERIDEYKAGFDQALENYSSAHPEVVYSRDELKALHLDRIDGIRFTTKSSDVTNDVKLSVSREEMTKLTSADSEFLQGLAQSIAGFSFVNEVGRPRLIGTSDANDMANFGGEDLTYYSEMAHKAKLVTMAYHSNPRGTLAILGQNTQQLLNDCAKVIAVFEEFKKAMGSPGLMPSELKRVYDQNTGKISTHEDMEIERQKQIRDYENKRLRMMRSEHV
ncbi:MAG: hypothetical protein K6E19_01110 [Lachnospiraceae bacterium]|nr:hypothetical protein [Lachnospiraceae bacterium]